MKVMELDEMKNAWIALDNRLKENESLKEVLILEMIHTKTNKSLNRLINWETFGMVILILVIPLCAYSYHQFGGKFVMWDAVIIVAAIVCVFGFIWQNCKIHGLMKFDLSKQIRDNIYCTNRYNIQIKREKMITNCIVVPILAILSILAYVEMKVAFHLWIFMTSSFILIMLVTYWSYKRFYDKNINSILKSLNEIKELKEEE